MLYFDAMGPTFCSDNTILTKPTTCLITFIVSCCLSLKHEYEYGKTVCPQTLWVRLRFCSCHLWCTQNMTVMIKPCYKPTTSTVDIGNFWNYGNSNHKLNLNILPCTIQQQFRSSWYHSNTNTLSESVMLNGCLLKTNTDYNNSLS